MCVWVSHQKGLKIALGKERSYFRPLSVPFYTVVIVSILSLTVPLIPMSSSATHNACSYLKVGRACGTVLGTCAFQ